MSDGFTLSLYLLLRFSSRFIRFLRLTRKGKPPKNKIFDIDKLLSDHGKVVLGLGSTTRLSLSLSSYYSLSFSTSNYYFIHLNPLISYIYFYLYIHLLSIQPQRAATSLPVITLPQPQSHETQ